MHLAQQRAVENELRGHQFVDHLVVTLINGLVEEAAHHGLVCFSRHVQRSQHSPHALGTGACVTIVEFGERPPPRWPTSRYCWARPTPRPNQSPPPSTRG